MHKLTFHNTEAGKKLAHPGTRTLSTDGSALEIFTDFNRQDPLMVEMETLVTLAQKVMQRSHIHSLMVVDHNDNFVGLLCAEDISSQQIIRRVAQGANRHELCVADFMQPSHKLMAFDYEELAHSTIGDVIATLSGSGHRHCLVTDSKTGQVQGIISTTDIRRRLGLTVADNHHAGFAEIFHEVYPREQRPDGMSASFTH